MSKNTQLLEDTKLEIRSILLASQKGLTLQKFLRDYKDVVGYPIPFRELGYDTPVEFFKRVPEVMNMVWLPELHDYLLTAVADEKTSHIEKMVAKQKTSKTSLPVSRKRLTQLSQVPHRLRSSEVPLRCKPSRSQKHSKNVAPRFLNKCTPFLPADVKQEINQLLKDYPDGISYQNFLIAYKRKFGKELKYQEMGFYTIHECLGAVSGLLFRPIQGEQRVLIPTSNKSPTMIQATVPDVKSNTTYCSQRSNIPDANQKAVEKTSLPGTSTLDATYCSQRPDILKSTQKPAYKTPLLETPNVQFHGAQQSIFVFKGNQSPSPSMPQLETTYSADSWKPIPPQKSNPFQANRNRLSFPAASETPEYHQSDTLDDIDGIDDNYDDHSGIGEAMKKNFRKILQMNPDGIWAADFPKCYEELTGHKFNLSELGYFSLVELANALPDIFKRVRPPECKSDWLLFYSGAAENLLASPDKVQSTSKSSMAYVEQVISNIRKILVGYPEGVYLDDIIHLYTLNCDSSLVVTELGFDNIEKFLLKIADRVPLKFDYSSARKKVRLGYCAAPVFVLPNVTRSSVGGREIPEDAVMPGMQYELQAIPALPDGSEYIPITVGTIVNPDNLWIQLVGPSTSDALDDLMEKLECFYNGPVGNNYIIRDCHIIVGMIAVGIWDGDAAWHRISITGMSSNTDYVDASFVDYGTRAKVKKTDLRYLKKEFLSLPAQAIKAYMAFVRPVGDTWSDKTYSWLMRHLRNRTIMAEIVKPAKSGEPVSVWMCDCSYEEDKFLNLMLVECGLAYYCNQDAAPGTIEANNIKKPLGFQEKLSHYEPSQASSFSTPSQANTFPAQAASQGSVTPADIVKALATLSQLQSTSPLNSQLLLEWILRLVNPSGNASASGGAPMNTPLLQQVLGTGVDLTTVLKLLASAANNPLGMTSQNMTNSAYVPPSNANPFASNVTSGFPSAYSNTSFANSSSGAPSTERQEILPPSSIPAARTLSDFARHTQLPEFPSTHIAPPNDKNYIQPPRSNEKQTDVVNNPVSSPYVSPADSDSEEIFDDDDDDEETLEKLYAQYGVKRQRFVLRINMKDGYRFHTVVVESVPYVSCGDVSRLLWSNEDSDCLSRRLRGKDIAFSTLTIYDSDYPEVFHQLRCFKVSGIKTSDQRSSIILYHLRNVIDILNIFGHPSKTIRAEILYEISKFNPADDLWQNFSLMDISDEEDSTGTTDSDKFKRMCIFDLKATLEGLRFKRLKLMSGLTNAKDVNPKDIQEVRKIEQQFQVYEKRIKEIEVTCKTSDSATLPV